MRPAILVFGYAVAVAWYLPALLARLTRPGISARLGLAAWLTAMASALASLAIAVAYLVTAAVGGWSQLAVAVCRSVTGGACSAGVYRSAVFELALGLASIGAALTMGVLAWRYGRTVQRAQRSTRAHGEAARITGRRLLDTGTAAMPGGAARGSLGTGATVVLDAPQPAAYCVPGRPAAIVLTSGALAVLDAGQLRAVLAHERAHLAGHHHLLIALTRGLAVCFPAVPLFARGAQEVTRLTEMCADDAAARHSSRPALITALLAMGTGTAVPAAALTPAAALGAATCAVAARVQRLLDPATRARHARNRLALAAVIAALALLSATVTRFAGPLAGSL